MGDRKGILVEIGTEEIPARMMEDAIDRLENDLDDWMSEQRLSKGDLTVMGTPRRLVVHGELPSTQEESVDRIKGPPVKVAYDDDGNPTEALNGFCQQHGVDEDDVQSGSLDDGEYIFVEQKNTGDPISEVLKESFADIILDLEWPKSMRWEESACEFVRPIRWVVSFIGDEFIELRIGPVESEPESRGLRFTDNERVQVDSVEDYREKFIDTKKIIFLDETERRHYIREQAEELASEVDGFPVYDQELLDEVTHLVERPTPFRGNFDERFLNVPDPVLKESMQSHQKYFPVEGDEGLLPYFIGVRNGDDNYLETVVEGNQKVLRARLNDAEFFYENDLKTDYEHYRSELDGVVFQEELGSLHDKTERMTRIVNEIYDGQNHEPLRKATKHCKNDLVTDMVEEFPKLQGTMGKIYAIESGWSEETASIIEEHYRPRDRNDPLPGEEGSVEYGFESRVLAAVDRIDTLVGFFGLGKRATGSSDPFGLRRDALSTLRILLDERFDSANWDLRRLISIARSEFDNEGFHIDDSDIEDLHLFMEQRLKNLLNDRASHSVIRATVPVHWYIPHKAADRISWLKQWKNDERFEDLLTAFERVHNISSELEDEQFELDPDNFTTPEEKQLWEQYQEAKPHLEEALEEKNKDQVLTILSDLRSEVDQLFEEVMVMVEEEQLRKNRLATLNRICELYDRVADFSAFL